MPHIYMRHTTHTKDPTCEAAGGGGLYTMASKFSTHEWVISHTSRSHATQMHESCCTYKSPMYLMLRLVPDGCKVSRLPKNIGLFCRISSLLQGSFAKETYFFCVQDVEARTRWLQSRPTINALWHTHVWVVPRIYMSYVTHTFVPWLRLVDSLKTYVSFAKEPYKRDDILQQRPICFREPTPCSYRITDGFQTILLWMSHGTHMHKSYD